MGNLGPATQLPTIRKASLGKMGLVLLPLEKLKKLSPRGVPFEREVHDFLVTCFNGYTVASGNISGHWKDDAGRDHYGEHREYKVALPSASAREALEAFIATLASEMREQCVYFELGEETWLIYAARV